MNSIHFPFHIRLPLSAYRLLLTVFFFSLGHLTTAQTNSVRITILIPPPYSPYLQDYLQYENKMVIQLQNLSSQTLSLKIIGSIEGDNGVLITTSDDYAPATPITLLGNGTFRIPASIRSRGFFDPDHLDFSGPENLETKILKDGILPEGNYTICLEALDYDDNTLLSAPAPENCTLLPIYYPTPSQLLSPECDGNLESDHPFFQWSLPGGNTGNASLLYDLYIVEYLEGSSPEDLIALAVDYNAGNAIIRRNLLTPSYQYQVTDPKLKSGTTYLWVTKVRDRLGKLQFENNGQSEICLFNYQLPDDGDIFITNHIRPNDFQVQQVRTRVEGNLKYKFPGVATASMNMVPRLGNMQTENFNFQSAENAGHEFTIMNMDVMALAFHDYIDAFPVSQNGANPLSGIPVKLVESWVIANCNVTYLPQNLTVHKEFFILPNEFSILGGAFGGNSLSVIIDGISDTGEENPIDFGDGLVDNVYNRILDVDHTDGNGNYQFNFTQTTPGLLLSQYQGHATILLECEPFEAPVEGNDFVHPLDEQANPAEQYFDINAFDNPNEEELIGNIPTNSVLRHGQVNEAQGQFQYKQVEINGGQLFKVLRIEVASPFYYSPDLIFWTKPGDTVTLPDQVSYVKSVDLALRIEGGQWEQNVNYQLFDAGLPIPGVEVLFSRKREGLPNEIPMEEGQGLRKYEGEETENGGLQEIHMDVEQYGYVAGSLFDSVSILESDPDGVARFTRLVAGHPYYVKGASPEDGNINYDLPLQDRLYQIFDPGFCLMNLGMNLNSFSEHKAIQINDTLTAFPQRPKVFGRVVTMTEDDKVPIENVTILLQRFENNQLKQTIYGYSNEYGQFHFDQLAIDPAMGNEDMQWRIYFHKSGYEDKQIPNSGFHEMRPGQQWDLEDVLLVQKGLISGYVKDEDGRPVQALVKLVDGPHIQTDLVSLAIGQADYCGDVNNFGDALNKSTKLYQFGQMQGTEIMQAEIQQSARFLLPSQSGDNLQLMIIPLPEQYFQDTCFVDIDDIPHGQVQQLGNFTVKEKLHRIMIAVKGPEGNPVQAKVYVDDHVRQIGELGWAAFRFASPETNYRVRIVPELPTLVPVDTIISIPISKTYLQRTFHLKQGRRLQFVVVRDKSGEGVQSVNPIPIQGAVVQTLLSSSPTGNSYIQCITNQDGICVLEGVPTGMPTVDVTAWKEDDEYMYIGKTVQVSTSRPFSPPFSISLKRLGGVNVPDIWGFPTAITGMEIKTVSGGGKDTLLDGIITSLPENPRFKSAQPDVQIPYSKVKFTYQGRRDDNGKKILEPVNNGISLQQSGIEAILFDQFDVTLKPKRYQGYTPLEWLYLQKVTQEKGRITGVVETELSSFNFSYGYTGKFYLGNTPTEYNIDVFQSQQSPYAILNAASMQLINQEPSPGPDDFYLMNIGAQNKPRSQHYSVYQFEASSDSSRSFVNQNAFYIHTILHTDIADVTPRDLELSIGKIKVTNDDIEAFGTGTKKLDFKMGSLWHYYSTTPFHYDPDLGAITASEGYISTGQVDVPMRNPIIKPTQLIMNDVDQISQLTLAGIKDLSVKPGVSIVLSKGIQNIGWMLTAQKLDGNGIPQPDETVAEIKNLPLLLPADVIKIQSILLNSEDADMDLVLNGIVRPHDIADFTVDGITTGQGYFILTGSAELGREGVRVPGLPESVMAIQYNGPKNNLTGKIVSSYSGLMETSGQVSFRLDPNTANATKQFYSNRKFVSTGEFRVYEGQHDFKLKGILEVTYNEVKIHVIDKDLNIPNLDYSKSDQSILLGNEDKALLVRSGLQKASGDEWESLSFSANMKNFQGVKVDQPPMLFTVHGPVETTNATLKVDNIDLGFAAIALTYDFPTQALTGYMDFDPPAPIVLGPVSVDQVEAMIRVDPKGFLFASTMDGAIAAAFNARLGLLLGSHTKIPKPFITLAMKHAKNRNIPDNLADEEINGFFITGRVDLIDVEMPEVNLLFFGASGAASVGFDARVYMDFSRNGDAAFGFGALAFAGAVVEAWVLIPPVPCPEPTICLAAELQLLLEGELNRIGGNWEVAGHGCGSMTFSASACGIGESIGGRADIEFRSGYDPNTSVTLDATCAGGASSEFDCD